MLDKTKLKIPSTVVARVLKLERCCRIFANASRNAPLDGPLREAFALYEELGLDGDDDGLRIDNQS